ncbi:TPA: BspA family leucine-rich repeat surface protein [Enterococcus faecium]
MIEEASAHEEEEKAPLLRGGSPQITDWTYTEDGTTITLTGYTGSSTDVVIPTAQDFGFDESYTAQISKDVLKSVAGNKTSLSTSDNGNKIVGSSTSLGSCFYYNTTLTTVDLNNLDTSNVTNMSSMFTGCSKLTSVEGINNWDTSNVTNMSSMFTGCSSLTILDLSSWNCDKVTNYGSMFQTSDSTPLLVKTTDTMLKNYNYASDNRTKLGKVKIAAENGKFEGDVQELSLFDYTTDRDLTEASVTSQLTTRKKALIPNEGYMFKEWTPEATYTTFAEKAGGTYTAEVKQADWEWTYDSTNNVVTLTKYIGESKDVVIPTAKDCEHEGATAQISKSVLQQAATGATSLTTSDNGDKIVVSSTDLSNCFGSNETLITVDLTNLDVSKVTIAGRYGYYQGSDQDNLGIFFNCSKLTSVDVSNWNTSNMASIKGMFNRCRSLTSVDVSKWNTSNVTDMAGVFFGCSSLTSVDVSKWDTSNATNIADVFSDCSSLTSVDVSKWDTSNATNIAGVFSDCSSLTSVDVSKWDTSNVTDMSGVFFGCRSLTSLDVNNWDISKVKKLYQVFLKCSSLTSLDVSKWNTSNVTAMSGVFSGCSSLTSLDVSKLDTSNVTTMSYMFFNCSRLTILDLSSWNCDKVTNANYMFKTSDSTPLLVKTTDTKLKNYSYASNNRTKFGTVKIASENGKFKGNTQELTLFDAYTTDQAFNEELINSQLEARKNQLSLEDWVTFKEWTPEATYTTFAEKAGGTYTASITHGDWKWTYDSTNEIVTLTEYIGESAEVVIPTAKDCGHEGATAKISKEVLQQAAAGANSLTTSSNGDKIVVSSTDLNRCFEGYATLTTIDLTNLDTSSVENMDALFYNCTALTELDVHNWDTSQVTSMIGTFNSCEGLTELDVSDWDTGKVENMAFLFYGCEALTNLTIGSWDTKNVTSMQGMFVDCHQLTSLKLNRWNTNKVTNMSSLFFGCTSLEELEIDQWNTGNVTAMDSMFNDCSKLTSLPIGGWDVRKVTRFDSMFANCNHIQQFQLNSWVTSSATNMSSMFSNCTALTSLKLENWVTEKVTNLSHMFEGCNGLVHLDLEKWEIQEQADLTDIFQTNTSEPLLVEATADLLIHYDYDEDNRTCLGKVKVSETYGSFKTASLQLLKGGPRLRNENETEKQELSLFGHTISQDLTDEVIEEQLEAMKEKLNLKDNYMFVKWVPDGDYESLLEKANGTYEAEVCALDYLLTIPKYYMLTDRHTYAQGQVGLFDKEQTNQPYTGNLLVDVTMSSKNGFHLGTTDTAATYQLVDGEKQAIRTEGETNRFILKKDHAVQAVNAELTKPGAKDSVGQDQIIFNYQAKTE